MRSATAAIGGGAAEADLQFHRLAAGTLMIAEAPELPYYCPLLRSRHLQHPCEKNLARVAAMQKAGLIWLGLLQHCLDCQGDKLEKKEMSKSNVEVTVVPEFCPKHPGERHLVIQGNGPRSGQLMGACKSCISERKVGRPKAARISPPPKAIKKEKEIPAIEPPASKLLSNPCRKHPDRPAQIDKLGRNMGYCNECVRERGRINAAQSQKWGRIAAPLTIPLNQEKYRDLKDWLVGQAEENERTLGQEIIYRLKIARRLAEGELHGRP